MMSFNNYVSSAVTFAGFCWRVINLDWPYFIACLNNQETLQDCGQAALHLGLFSALF